MKIASVFKSSGIDLGDQRAKLRFPPNFAHEKY